MSNCMLQEVEFDHSVNLRFYISEYNGQGHLANDERDFTKKYHLQRSFESLIK